MKQWLSNILTRPPKGEHLWSAVELVELDNNNWLEHNWQSEWQHTLDYGVRMHLCREALALNGPILEIGAGAGGGNIAPLLHLDKQRQLIINDIDPRITERWGSFLAAKLPGSNVAPCAFDAAQMPLRDGSIQCVSSRGGLSNCRADNARVLSECARVLHPSGKLILYEMCISQATLSKMPKSLRSSLYLNAWALGEWRQLVEAQGFCVAYDVVSESQVLREEDSALAFDASCYGFALEVEWRGMIAVI